MTVWKDYRVATDLRPDVKRELQAWAKDEDRPLASLVRRLLEEAVERREAEADNATPAA